MSGKSKYEVGQEFPNRKRLVECVGSHPKYRTKLWIWECMDCGTKGGPSMTPSITRDKRPACCYQSPKGKSASRWIGYEELTGVWLHSYKYNAQKRGIEWSVSPEYLWELWLNQHRQCYYTGRILVHGDTASLDRIDNNQGYVIGNVKWVHRNVNRMKSNFTDAEFLAICSEVADFSAGRI